MTTGTLMLTEALKAAGIIGVGQPASGEDITDALFHLNVMLGQWNRKRWMVYHLVDTAFTSTGAQSYTVGPNQNFNIVRPDRIEAAYFRQLIEDQPNLVDYPLDVLQSYEDYARIRLKTLTTWPQVFFYDSGYPTGKLYVHPVPQASLFEIHILTKDVLASIAANAVAQTYNLPPEYDGAILWNLAVRLRAAYGMAPDPVKIGLAKDALNVIRNSNTQIPRMRMPAALRGGQIYNIFSDQSGGS